MRKATFWLLILSTMACEPTEPRARRVDPLARALAQQLAPIFAPDSVRGSPIVVFLGGGTAWDTLVAGELRLLQPAAFAPMRDTLYVRGFSTHGFELRGDTASVRASWDTCHPPAHHRIFTWWAVHLDYNFVRVPGSTDWRYLGHEVTANQDGECTAGVHRGPGRGAISPPAG